MIVPFFFIQISYCRFCVVELIAPLIVHFAKQLKVNGRSVIKVKISSNSKLIVELLINRGKQLYGDDFRIKSKTFELEQPKMETRRSTLGIIRLYDLALKNETLKLAIFLFFQSLVFLNWEDGKWKSDVNSSRTSFITVTFYESGLTFFFFFPRSDFSHSNFFGLTTQKSEFTKTFWGHILENLQLSQSQI